MIQVVLGFATDLGKSGAWDEVYYDNGADTDAAQVRWAGAAQTFLTPVKRSGIGIRLSALSSQCYLYYARFSLVGVRNSSVLKQVRLPGFRSSENFAGDACVVRGFSVSGVTHREFRFGGLPDNVVDGNEIDQGFYNSYINPLGGGSTLVPTTFLGWHLSNGGQILFRDTPLGGADSYQISAASKPDQYGLITLTLDRPRTWDLKIPVDLTCRGQPQLRGRWRLATYANTTPPTVTLAGSQRVSAPAGFVGQLTVATMAGSTLGSAGQPFLGAHKLGKKKFQRRGRQSPKLLRR